MSKNIFVFCEQREGVLQNVSLELLGIARELAAVTKEKVCAMLLGDNVKELSKEIISHGADIVYLAQSAHLKSYITEQYTQAAAQIITQYQPNIVLFPATSLGRDLAPRLSARLRTGLTADCTKLEVDENGNLFMTRPAFGGNLFATIICPDHKPQMSTVRPGVMVKLPADYDRKGEVVEVKVKFDASKFLVTLVEEKTEKTEETSIETCKALVSVGRGMMNNIEGARELAFLLGGGLSCSRAVVDSGVLPSQRQVGQTGKTVRPQLYLAMGVSGAVQHLAGMSDSELIIAINKDKAATIFNVAHLAIVGDAAAILPHLKREIEAIKAQ